MSAQRDPWWRVLVCPELLLMGVLVFLLGYILMHPADFMYGMGVLSELVGGE